MGPVHPLPFRPHQHRLSDWPAWSLELHYCKGVTIVPVRLLANHYGDMTFAEALNLPAVSAMQASACASLPLCWAPGAQQRRSRRLGIELVHLQRLCRHAPSQEPGPIRNRRARNTSAASRWPRSTSASLPWRASPHRTLCGVTPLPQIPPQLAAAANSSSCRGSTSLTAELPNPSRI
jgi:hypothetical protein